MQEAGIFPISLRLQAQCTNKTTAFVAKLWSTWRNAQHYRKISQDLLANLIWLPTSIKFPEPRGQSSRRLLLMHTTVPSSQSGFFLSLPPLWMEPTNEPVSQVSSEATLMPFCVASKSNLPCHYNLRNSSSDWASVLTLCWHHCSPKRHSFSSWLF